MTPDNIRTFERIVNVCENNSGSPETDYRSIYIYKDGKDKRKQVTLARGFTDDGGNLKRVILTYIAKGGKRAPFFRTRLSKFGTGVLHLDAEFLKQLRDAHTEQEMRAAQDEVFLQAYLNPALKWAGDNGFKEVLSYGVVVDSYLHSGSILGWLRNKFSERVPAAGGNEMRWIIDYLKARLAWFERSSGALHTCQFRPKFFLTEIEKGNWNLNGPLYIKGSRVI